MPGAGPDQIERAGTRPARRGTRIQSGWTDVFAIDKHENDARERIAAATAALRKRTIELLVKADEQMAQ